MAFIASTYFLNVGDKRLDIGAFSIEIIALGRSGLVKARYNATFAPLSSAKVRASDTWNVQPVPHYGVLVL
jgi:hypothetical protein